MPLIMIDAMVRKGIKKNLAAMSIPIFALLTLLCFLHVWRLGDVPRGLYIDESAQGYNAILISQTGRDQHGVSFPVYFRSFGDYTGPYLIYGAALLFKLIPPSDATIRAVSAFYFIIFLSGLFFLLRALFQTSKYSQEILLYGLAAAGLLPWFFTLSRLGFHVSSQLPFFIYSLLFVHLTYHSAKPKWFFPIIAGLLLGLATDSYHTSKLLAPLLFLCVVFLYFRRRTALRSFLLLLGYIAGLIPYISFAVTNPTGNLDRFRSISYIFTDQLSLWEKTSLFFANYFRHIHPEFLLFHGDRNIRHAVPGYGQLYIIVFLLFLTGLLVLLFRKSYRKHTFTKLLLSQLLLSPVAAALTNESLPHAIRSNLVGMYIILISCFGILVCYSIRIPRIAVSLLIFGILIFEAGPYIHTYFTSYAQVSAHSFGSYGIADSLKDALVIRPKRIFISHSLIDNGFNKTFYDFYTKTIPNPKNIPIERKPFTVIAQEPLAHTCIIFRTPEEETALRDLAREQGLHFSLLTYHWEQWRRVLCFK